VVTRYRLAVKPGSRKGPLVETGPDGTLTVFVRERAVDGAANDGVVRALSEHLGVPKSRIAIVRGHTSRSKVADVDD
jgi:uncharacterized protein YggU (UPF0235/DUF167 family)